MKFGSEQPITGPPAKWLTYTLGDDMYRFIAKQTRDPLVGELYEAWAKYAKLAAECARILPEVWDRHRGGEFTPVEEYTDLFNTSTALSLQCNRAAGVVHEIVKRAVIGDVVTLQQFTKVREADSTVERLTQELGVPVIAHVSDWRQMILGYPPGESGSAQFATWVKDSTTLYLFGPEGNERDAVTWTWSPNMQKVIEAAGRWGHVEHVRFQERIYR